LVELLADAAASKDKTVTNKPHLCSADGRDVQRDLRDVGKKERDAWKKEVDKGK